MGYENYFLLEISGCMKKCVGLVWVLVFDLVIVFFDELLVGFDLVILCKFDELVL